MSEGEELHLGGEERVELIERERAVVVHRHKAQPCAGAFRDQLPGHEVAVVLHFREENHIACPQELPTPSVRDEIDALGRPTGKDDFIGARGVDVSGHACARFLVGLGRAGAERVQTTMHIRVVVLVVARDRFNDRARLLRRRCVIKINQRLPVNFLVENREILTDGGPIGHLGGDIVHSVKLPHLTLRANRVRRGGIYCCAASNSFVRSPRMTRITPKTIMKVDNA